MTIVKICGVKDKAQALAAIEAGADLIGLVFAPSKRQVNPDQACEVARAVKESRYGGGVVGVFVNMPASQVNHIADFCALDWVQLSGDEPWEYCRQIARPVIKAIRIDRQSPEELYAELSAGTRLLTTQRPVALLDSRVEDKYGGTGETFDWNSAERLAEKFTILVAGGLTPDNVARLIDKVRPWGVDVSSGVETEGVKDIAKIRAFIEAVRRADGKKQADA